MQNGVITTLRPLIHIGVCFLFCAQRFFAYRKSKVVVSGGYVVELRGAWWLRYRRLASSDPSNVDLLRSGLVWYPFVFPVLCCQSQKFHPWWITCQAAQATGPNNFVFRWLRIWWTHRWAKVSLCMYVLFWLSSVNSALRFFSNVIARGLQIDWSNESWNDGVRLMVIPIVATSFMR